MYMYMIK